MCIRRVYFIVLIVSLSFVCLPLSWLSCVMNVLTPLACSSSVLFLICSSMWYSRDKSKTEASSLYFSLSVSVLKKKTDCSSCVTLPCSLPLPLPSPRLRSVCILFFCAYLYSFSPASAHSSPPLLYLTLLSSAGFPHNTITPSFSSFILTVLLLLSPSFPLYPALSINFTLSQIKQPHSVYNTKCTNLLSL